MSGGKREPKFFVGAMVLQPASALDAFLRSAAPGNEFVYCEAPSPMYGETWTRAGELAQQGYIRTHHRRRQGGGWQWYAVRTSRPLPKQKAPEQKALDDPVTRAIFDQLKREANLGVPCSTDGELAKLAGLDMRQKASWRVRRLIDVGLIKSIQLYENNVPTRVIEILETRWAGSAGGKFTAFPAKYAALQRAAEADVPKMTAGGAR